MDETWLYHYDPKTKQKSMEWSHSGSLRPKKIRVQKSAGKVLASIFWDQDGILLIDYLPKGQTINAEYYSSLLVQLKEILKEKRRGTGRSPMCSPDICNTEETALPVRPTSGSPTVFSGSGPIGLPPVPYTEKKQLKVRHFSSDAGVIVTAEIWLDEQFSEFFSVACKRYNNGLRSVLSFEGSMLNKPRFWTL